MTKGEKDGKRAFIDVGFTKWKDMKALFEQHADSVCHKSSMVLWTEWRVISSKQKQSIASKVSFERSAEVLENRSPLKTLLRATSFLGRQEIAFRGHDECEESDNKGNFREFLETLSDIDENLKSRMEPRYGHYTSPEYQNDFIQVFGDKIERTITAEILEAKFCAVMVDETKDISKNEQLALIIRYFHNGCIKERVIGTYHMKGLDATSLSKSVEHGP